MTENVNYRKGGRVVWITVRQLTGDPLAFHGYVIEDKTNRVLASCQHRHMRRGRSTKSGEVYARACAERMAQRYLRSEFTARAL